MLWWGPVLGFHPKAVNATATKKSISEKQSRVGAMDRQSVELLWFKQRIWVAELEQWADLLQSREEHQEQMSWCYGTKQHNISP